MREAIVVGVEEFVERLQRDVGSAHLIGVYSLDAGRWLVGDGDVPTDFTGPGLVARMGGWDHQVEGADPLLDLASFAHDGVIDETGRSWPDMVVEGTSMHLEPVRRADDVWWADRGRPVCRIGELATLTVAAA